jgi:hypothetical protein
VADHDAVRLCDERELGQVRRTRDQRLDEFGFGVTAEGRALDGEECG